MPTAVESIAKLGAVLVQLPASDTSVFHVSPGSSDTIGGRSGLGSIGTLQHHTPTHPGSGGVDNTGAEGSIGGRSGVGPVSIFNPHLPEKKPPHAEYPGHKAPVHHPVHTTPAHGVDTGYEPIGGRSGIGLGALLPAVHTTPQAVGRAQPASLLPAVQKVIPEGPSTEDVLRPLMPGIGSALQAVMPANQRTLEAVGIGTDRHTLDALIGLLRKQGFHVTTAFCDGSVRPGFSGPTAILRAHGGSTVGLFLQQVAVARAGGA